MRVNTLVHAVCIVAVCFLTAEAGTAQTLPCYPRTSYHLQALASPTGGWNASNQR